MNWESGFRKESLAAEQPYLERFYGGVLKDQVCDVEEQELGNILERKWVRCDNAGEPLEMPCKDMTGKN